MLLPLTPLLIVGVTAFAAPYFLIKLLSTRVLKIDLEEQATYKLFGGVMFYPLWIALLSTWVGWEHGTGWGVLVALLLPVLAVLTLFAWERQESVVETVQAYFAWQRMSPGAARAMVSQRQAIADAVDRLAAEMGKVSRRSLKAAPYGMGCSTQNPEPTTPKVSEASPFESPTRPNSPAPATAAACSRGRGSPSAACRRAGSPRTRRGTAAAVP